MNIQDFKPTHIYIHASMFGTYEVPASLINQDGDKALILFKDVWIDEYVTRWVNKQEIRLLDGES
jgi:hypothetical protein